MVEGQTEESSGFAGGGVGLRQEGGSEACVGLAMESSGLEMPTRRNIFPAIRTRGCVFNPLTLGATLF